MSDAEKQVRQVYPDAYVAGCWGDGKLLAFIYNPTVAHGHACVSDTFITPEEAWQDALRRIEAARGEEKKDNA